MLPSYCRKFTHAREASVVSAFSVMGGESRRGPDVSLDARPLDLRGLQRRQPGTDAGRTEHVENLFDAEYETFGTFADVRGADA